MAFEVAVGGVTLVLLCWYALICKFSYKKYAGIPMALPRVPFIGNAGNIDMSRCHMVLTEWAQRFGSVFRIKIFNEEILVLSDYESIHDALVTKASAFAGRPPMYRTSRARRDKHSIVWQTYTDKLHFLRKETLKSLKMYGDGMDNLEHRCLPEIQAMLANMEKYSGESFDPWDHIYDAVSNVMLGLTLNTTFDHSSENFQMIKDINYLFNDTFSIGNARCMDFLLNRLYSHAYSKQLHKALELRDKFWDEELKRLKVRDTDCIVQRFLSITSQPNGKQMDVTEDTAKEVFTNLILAGTDTTSTSLACLLLIFLHHPNVQEKMWEELHHQVGDSRLATLADRVHMPYFQAVLLELLRYISHVPLAVPHYTTCDTDVLGIPVPKNMTVYINLWSHHHDPRHWPDPWAFKPDRFLDAKGQLLPVYHEVRRKLMPFGAGRRVCLGEALAKNRLFLFAAALVQRLKFMPGKDDELPPLDPRTFDMGIVLHPKRFRVRTLARH